MWPLGGGAEHYLSTLEWILRQCHAGDRGIASIAELYGQHYGLNKSVATQQVGMLRKYGLLELQAKRCVPSSDAARWLETGHAEIVIGTLHANIRFIGELLDEIQHPRSREQLRRVANDTFGFDWKKVQQIAYRLNWLRSAGLAEVVPGWKYQTTVAGLAFLKRVELQRPASVSAPAPDETPPDPPSPSPPVEPGPVPTMPSSLHEGGEIAQRLRALSCDGKKHGEFEMAVRDAFEFLGFDADHLSGAGQTDVLLTATHAGGLRGKGQSPNWLYRVTVDSKAVTGGRLTSNQVNWPALEKHRQQHDAQFSLLVGPSPGGQLLQFAADQNVGVLDAAELAALCEAHASVPLAPSVYFALFADRDGNPQGGLIDTSAVESARDSQDLRQQLLAQVLQAVETIAPSFKPPDASLVHFNLSQSTSGQRISEPLITEALELLASPWLGALTPVGDEGPSERYVPAASGRVVAQRLRWLADAFADETDDTASSAGSG